MSDPVLDPGYEDISAGVRRYQYAGYEDISYPGYKGISYPGHEGISTRVLDPIMYSVILHVPRIVPS